MKAKGGEQEFSVTIATVYRHRENKERDGQTERDKSRLIFFLPLFTPLMYSYQAYSVSLLAHIIWIMIPYTITPIGYSHDQLTWLFGWSLFHVTANVINYHYNNNQSEFYSSFLVGFLISFFCRYTIPV